MMSRLKFENDGNSEEYKIEVICNSVVYTNANKLEGDLPGLYYLVLWKNYPKEEITYIGKFYPGPIHLADPDSTWSSLIYSGVLLIYLRVPQLAPIMTRSNQELVSRLQSHLNTLGDSSFPLIDTWASHLLSQNYRLSYNY